MKRIAAALLASSLIAGCGGSAGSDTAAPSRPATSGGTPAPVKPAAGGSKVKIVNFKYAPATIEVHVGDKVTWTNKDSANHTVTGDSGGVDVSNLSTGQSASYTYKQAGTYRYHCDFHPFMKGRVVVR